ncbi:MAG: type II toxin-antitoxin system RelE/ParE family toxin [Candidatus Accumulibacter sp.]|jgi:mRNA interferase RelE/StbE|nr:type II toxin-antitoxin system RelE/ParE family toxin [Accumulibacter sp.]
MYQLEYSRSAWKALQSMPRNIALLIVEKLASLAQSPMDSPNVKKLAGRPGYRLRVGDWRIIYELEQKPLPEESERTILVVTVLAIAPRGGVYQ